MSLAAERVALTDRRLRKSDCEVYRVLLEELDTREFRAVKRSYLKRRVEALIAQTWEKAGPTPQVHEANVARSIRRLVQHGYLERETSDQLPRRYRLLYSPRVARLTPSEAA